MSTLHLADAHILAVSRAAAGGYIEHGLRLANEFCQANNAAYRIAHPRETVPESPAFQAHDLLTAPRVSVIEALKLLACIDYNCDDQKSPVFEATACLVKLLPGYDAAPWTLDEEEGA